MPSSQQPTAIQCSSSCRRKPALRGVALSGSGRGLAIVGRDLTDAMPSTQGGAARIDGDPAQPGIEAIGVAKGWQLPPHGQKGLLRCVLCIGLPAEDGERRSIHDIDLSAHEGIECRPVAMASALDELSLQASSSLDEPLPDSMRIAAIRFAAILVTRGEGEMPRVHEVQKGPARPGVSLPSCRYRRSCRNDRTSQLDPPVLCGLGAL